MEGVGYMMISGGLIVEGASCVFFSGRRQMCYFLEGAGGILKDIAPIFTMYRRMNRATMKGPKCRASAMEFSLIKNQYPRTNAK